MGCLQCKTDGNQKEPSIRSGSRSPEMVVVPEMVQGLQVSQLPGQQLAVTVSWRPPVNMSCPEDILHYYVRVSSKISSKVVRNMELEGSVMQVEMGEREGLQPLHQYIFAVQAMGAQHRKTGDWSMTECIINWSCKFPGCETNRLKLEDGTIYSFCSREHKVEFDESYCLYGNCTEKAVYVFTPTPSSAGGRNGTLLHSTSSQQQLVREREHFCCHGHYYRVASKAADTSHAFFLEVRPGSLEYRSVEEQFHKKWSASNGKKTRVPRLKLILAVLNPALQEKFDNYKWLHIEKEKKDPKMVKRLFYGTKLDCDLHTYQIPCKGADVVDSCGTCYLALHGFSQLSMVGVMLDKNPARSHEKAKIHEDSLTYGLLLCDVTCANSKRLSSRGRTVSESEIKPEGYDAVTIKSRRGSFLKTSTDEVVVYRADAVCPRYILLYVV